MLSSAGNSLPTPPGGAAQAEATSPTGSSNSLSLSAGRGAAVRRLSVRSSSDGIASPFGGSGKDLAASPFASPHVSLTPGDDAVAAAACAAAAEVLGGGGLPPSSAMPIPAGGPSAAEPRMSAGPGHAFSLPLDQAGSFMSPFSTSALASGPFSLAPPPPAPPATNPLLDPPPPASTHPAPAEAGGQAASGGPEASSSKKVGNLLGCAAAMCGVRSPHPVL